MKEKKISRFLKISAFLSASLTMLVASLFLPSFTSSSPVKADSKTTKVKVGWYQSSGFQEGLEGEKKGYSYEYLQKVSDYTTWSYDYVGGEWTGLFNDLKTGEIDILAGVSHTVEREEYMYFPNYEMGKEAYYIYQHENRKTMKASDISTFSGKKIGAIENNLMSDYLEKWNEKNNANLNIVYYSGFEERDDAFAKDQIDGIVSTDNNVFEGSGYSLVTKVGEDPYYLAVTKTRPDLLNDLNESLALIQETDPYFLQNLEYSYFGNKLTNSSKTELEVEWLQEHSTLKVGYLDNYLPYSSTDSKGNVKGLITDVVDAMLYELDVSESLKVEYVRYSNYSEMVEAIASKTIDTAFPIGGNAWDLEQQNIDASNIVLAAGMNLIYKDKYDLKDNGSFAVNKNNKLQYFYIKNHFPDSELIECESIDECLELILNGRAKYTIINGLRFHIFSNNDKYDKLLSIQLQAKSNRYFGVNQMDIGLLLLLNRGIKLIGSEFAINASYSYIESNSRMTLSSFFKQYTLQTILVIAIFVGSLIVFVSVYVTYIKKSQTLIKKNLAVNQELTERLEENNALLAEKAAEAERANNAKTEFLNNMSHDIRTPMNAILGYAELMSDKTDDPEYVENYLRKIKISGDYLLSIINNVLDMSRIESGRLERNEQFVDLLSAEGRALSNIQEMANRKKQTFVMRNTIVHRYVLADISKQQEIMMNLASNAIKYTPEYGRIEMVMDELECQEEGYGEYRLTVKDNGRGMSKEFLEHVFDPFTREQNTTESKIVGTGLGMAIVKKLVDFLGGTIEVQSELGKGTTFTVTFKHKIVDNPDTYLSEEKTKEETMSSLAGRRVMVVEDNDFNAEITQTVLENAGFCVERAGDGLECLKLFDEHGEKYYDAILMDIQMPNLNGYETTKRIRSCENKVKAGLPVIAMTANAFEEDRRKAIESGMNEHLAKPIDISELMKTLAKYLS